MTTLYKAALLALCTLLGYGAQAQTTSKLILNFGRARASAVAGYQEIDLLVAGDANYTTNNSTTTTTNVNGSWTGITFTYTQSGPAPLVGGDPAQGGQMTTSFPAGFSGSPFPSNTAPGGTCAYGAAFTISIARDTGPDATSTPLVILTIRYPTGYSAQRFTVRQSSGNASASCKSRESFWNNQADINTSTGARLATGSTSGATPLPVELTAFTATKQGKDGQLNWSTASEKNAAYFEVQASADGHQFQPIGRVAAAGTSSATRSYALVDKNIARYGAPLVYYRLHQVDADGTASFSPVRTLAPDAAAWAVTAYPNPFAQDLSAQIMSTESSPVTLSLYDALGRRVLHRQVAGNAGQQLVDLRSAALPTGAYVLHVQQGSHTGTVRLTKE